MGEYDLTIEESVVEYMKLSSSARDWDNRCDEVKRVNEGYPTFWYSAIMLSGVATAITAKWGSDAEIHLVTFPRNT